MTHKITRQLALGAAFLLGAAALRATTETTGPSTGVAPYMEFESAFAAAHPNAAITSLRAVTDGTSGGVAQMTGIPDGMGAFDNGDGTFTLLMNQEISSGGLVRAHGRNGAFVSKWIIDKATLQVRSITDLATKVSTWNGTGYTAPGDSPTTWSRFCSATVPPVSALYNPATGKGTTARAIMNGEEDSSHDTGWIHFATGPAAGISYQLPHLGRLAFENAGACPFPQDTTVVVSQDDGTTNVVTVYVGTKRSEGTEPEKAGLVGGTNYAIQVLDGSSHVVTSEATGTGSAPVSGTVGASADFRLEALPNSDIATSSVNMLSGHDYTRFARPEDGAWDPRPAYKNDYYFVCTASMTGKSRLYRLRFADIANPAAGGAITCLVEGVESDADAQVSSPKMMDNLTVDMRGRIYIQEDPGGHNRYTKIWEYDTNTAALTPVLKFKSSLFAPGGTTFTNDEESSGIFDISDILGEGKYLLAAQVHTGASGTTYPGALENGQLMLLSVPPSAVVTSGATTYDRPKTQATRTYTVKNTGGATLAGPVKLALPGLASGVSVVGASGTATVNGVSDVPYVIVSEDDLADGASAAVTVKFNLPSAGAASAGAAVVIP